MEDELLEYGKHLVERVREDYLAKVDEYEDCMEAEQDAIGGLIVSNYDKLAVIWASGYVYAAYDAVSDGVESHIFDVFYK